MTACPGLQQRDMHTPTERTRAHCHRPRPTSPEDSHAYPYRTRRHVTCRVRRLYRLIAVTATEQPGGTRTLDRRSDGVGSEEAGIARIYAGLHFRFDITAGQAIGAKVAALALTKVPGSTAAVSLL